MSDQTFDDLVYLLSGYTDSPITEGSRLAADLQISEVGICDLVWELPAYFGLLDSDYYKAVDGMLDHALDDAQTVGDLLRIIRRAGETDCAKEVDLMATWPRDRYGDANE